MREARGAEEPRGGAMTDDEEDEDDDDDVEFEDDWDVVEGSACVDGFDEFDDAAETETEAAAASGGAPLRALPFDFGPIS